VFLFPIKQPRAPDGKELKAAPDSARPSAKVLYFRQDIVRGMKVRGMISKQVFFPFP
jgi:hypothetical protein